MNPVSRPIAVSILSIWTMFAAACSGAGDLIDSGEIDEGDEPGDDDDGDDGTPDLDDVDDSGVVLAVCATGDADHATLTDAVAAAPSGSTIEVCPGTYQERVTVTGKQLVILGVGGAATTILDAGGDGVALTARDNPGAGVRVERLTIRGGDAGGGRGGGIRCDASGLRLVDSIVRDNVAVGGAGLFASGCALEVTGTLFENNVATENGGGALLIDSSGEVAASTFRGNQGHNNGGALHTREGSVLLRASEMRENSAWRGAGLYHDSDAPVEDNLFVANAAGWTGGGVHIVGHAPVFLRNVIQDNTSENDGGGIYVHQGTATIKDGTVAGNWCGDDGGGIRLFESKATIESNLIANNESAGDGGGIRVSHQPSLIVGNTIRDNEAAGGGGGIDMDNDSSVVRGGSITGNTAWRGGGVRATLFPWLGGTLEGVRIADNVAGHGGGLYIEDNFFPIALRDLEVVDNVGTDDAGGIFVAASDVTIRNSLVARNEAEEAGGGLLVATPVPYDPMEPCPCPPTSPSIDVDFVVFHGNVAPEGAAVWVDTTGLSVASSIISGHTGTAVTVAGMTPAPAWSYNDTMPASFAGMVDPTGSSGNISSNPQYADGTRFTLGAGSPCINAGDPAFTDVNGSRADMGRFGGPEAP